MSTFLDFRPTVLLNKYSNVTEGDQEIERLYVFRRAVRRSTMTDLDNNYISRKLSTWYIRGEK